MKLIRVLYVDDEPSLLDIGKLFLERLGDFSVTTASGVTEAINLLQGESFDVIISDYQMPEVDGIAFLKYLKSHKYTTPFILFTGRGREEVVIEALNEGADFYIQKGGEPKSQFAELSNKVRYAVSRRQAEDALVESEQRYRLMNDASLDFVYSYDMAGCFTSVNRRFCEALGLDAEQMLGKTHSELMFPPDLILDLDDLHREVYRTGSTVTGFISTPMPDGTIHEYENVSNPLYNSAGIIIGIAGTARDITERRKAENRLSELNSAFLSFSPDPLGNINILTSLAGKMLHATCALYNRLEEGMLCSLGIWNTPQDFSLSNPPHGHICYDVIRQEGSSATIIPDLMMSPYAETDPNVRRYNLQTYIGTPVKIGEKFLGSLCVVYRDIYSPSPQDLEILSFIARAIAIEDERRIAGISQNVSEDMFRLFIEQMSEGVSIVDNDGKIIEWNHAQERLSGISRNEAIGLYSWDIATQMIHDGNRGIEICSRIKRDIELIIKSGLISRPNLVNFRFNRPDGSFAIVNLTMFIIKTPDGNLLGTLYQDITKQRLAEERIKESEEKLAMVMNGISTLVSYMDTELRFVYANKAHAEWYRCSEGELIGKSLKEILPEEIFLRAKPYFQKVLNGSVTSFENTTRDRDGRERVLYVTLVPHIYEKQVVGFFAALEDITERKKAETALLESEERFRSIIHSMQFGIIIIDAQTHAIVEANSKALELIKGSSESVLGSLCHRFICPAELGRCPVSDLGQMVDSSERVLLTKQGESIPIIKSVIKTSLGGREVLIESFIDITDRKRVELALKESEEKYRTLFESAGDAIFIHDTDGWILSANMMACEQLGYTYPEILSMTVNQVDSPKEASLALARIAQLMKYGHLSFETEHIRKDGTLIPIEVRAQQIIWEGQHAVMSICRDISERKNSEIMFQTLVRSIVGSTGIESLHKITKNISSWLGAECVMVGEIQPDRQTVNVLSMLLDGQYVTDFSYTLKGTPCENVAEKGYCLYSDNAIQLFPDSRDLIALNIRGYMGTPLRNVDGEVIGILCALFRSPITHSAAMQEIINIIAVKASAEIEGMRMIGAIQESEERFRMLLEHVPSVAVQGFNMEGITQYWNEASTRLYGYTSEEAIGKNILDLIIPPDIKDEVRESFVLMSQTGQPIPAAEVSLMRKDGSRVTLFSSHAIVKRSKGSIELFCLDMDLSERKHTEEALKEANQKLRLLTSLTRHDIFNQLTAGQLFLDMALEISNSKKQAEYISQAYETNWRIESIIGFTREYETFGTASSGWLRLRETIDSASIEISLGIAMIDNQVPDNIEVYADPILRKVFATLMENAARHGGNIGCIRFSCQEIEHSLIITCVDDGIGIPVDEKFRIFNHGYGKHTGIGLFLAREILSITGLTIRECGEPGEGARFEILVPQGKFRVSWEIGI